MGKLDFNSGTAVVTGGGSGIGEGFVRHLAARGMHAVVVDISAERAELVAESIRSGGGSAESRQVDVTDFDAVDALAHAVFADRGSVELLINNAGIEAGGRLWTESPEKWRTVMDVNLNGVFYGVRAFVPRMLTQGGPAAIANMSSIGAVTTPIQQGTYVTSKHAVLALTEVLYRELTDEGADIQVAVLMPNTVRSRIFTDALEVPDATDDPNSAEFLARMQQLLDEGLDPVDAAEQMVEQLVRGEFWVTVGPRCDELIQARGEHLLNQTSPIANLPTTTGDAPIAR